MTVAQWEPSHSRLVEWATEADAAYALAERLTETSFCPPQFRRRPGDAMAAMLAGAEVGLSPLAAMNAFDVIEGRAAPRAITQRALVQARGHEIELVESTATRCVMRGRRAGASEWQTVTWTINRADQLGLTGKQNWRKQPQGMLVARATSEISRLVASDALLGLGGGYSAEEYADGGQTPEPSAISPSAPTGTRRMGRASAQGETLPPPSGGGTPPETEASEPPQADYGQPTEDDSSAQDRPMTPVERALSHVQSQAVPEDAPASEDAPESFREILGGTVLPDDADDEPTPEQRRKMFAAFGEAGWDMSDRSAEARQHRLEYVTRLIGRHIASSNDLTRWEMSLVIDALEADHREIQDAP